MKKIRPTKSNPIIPKGAIRQELLYNEIVNLLSNGTKVYTLYGQILSAKAIGKRKTRNRHRPVLVVPDLSSSKIVNKRKPIISLDEREQNEIEAIYKSKSKAEIANELRNIKPTDPKQIKINSKAYKRDNKTISLIKILRDFKCQICGVSIKKKDGTYYIEAAHITPKHQKGAEIPDNIILLFPNHHKEFDYGDLNIISQSKDIINFYLNDNIYKLNLKI